MSEKLNIEIYAGTATPRILLHLHSIFLISLVITEDKLLTIKAIRLIKGFVKSGHISPNSKAFLMPQDRCIHKGTTNFTLKNIF